jgi:pimeloyl-ACP methyl ester carboxylesterase
LQYDQEKAMAAEELCKIRTPVLLLIGDHEVLYKPERVIRRATQRVSNLKAEIVPNANHVAEYTAAEVVNEKILDFLAGQAPARDTVSWAA